MNNSFASVDNLVAAMERCSYITDRALATALFLSYHMHKPILLEGEAGVGKTEVGKVMASLLDTELIRLQCYEGLEANHALYEWNYSKQILYIRLQETGGASPSQIETSIFSKDFLIKRPLLQAITWEGPNPPVLLIDEIDRSDEEFEAFLLEVLSDFQITIPEIGTIKANRIPFVVLTSNRTRELNDALKRRCLYVWIPHPSLEKEIKIVEAKVPGVDKALAAQVCGFVHALRQINLEKKPGIAETLDWAAALVFLHRQALSPDVVRDTISCLLKSREDLDEVERLGIESLISEGQALAGCL